jgi:hypothetical protein
MQTALGRQEDLLKGQRLCKFDDLDVVGSDEDKYTGSTNKEHNNHQK